MRRSVLSVLTLAFILPLTVQAQQWNAEQQEVWEFELSCQESKEVWLGCLHEDYAAWGDMSLGIPVSKVDRAAIDGYSWDEQVVVHLKPLKITVRGNFAVALVMYTSSKRNRETGEVVTTSSAWTDVCIKEDGRWYWIADHGTVVEPN